MVFYKALGSAGKEILAVLDKGILQFIGGWFRVFGESAGVGLFVPFAKVGEGDYVREGVGVRGRGFLGG
jgi:hypothetical protein